MVENYEGRPELEFLKSCPTNWETTVIPEAAIGEYVTVARKERGGDNWFIGAITNSKSRDAKVKLDFLDKDATYTAKVFKDGFKADYRTNPYPVDIETKQVKAGDELVLNLANGGGAAVMIVRNKPAGNPTARN